MLEREKLDREIRELETKADAKLRPAPLRVKVVDENNKPLTAGRCVVRQGRTTDEGSISAGAASLKRIDPAQAFEFGVEGRVCRIVEGAAIAIDEPGVEYGGPFVDWRQADTAKADTDFWPFYEAERTKPAAGPDLPWQHDHIARRPIVLRKSFVGSAKKTPVFQASPVRLRTGPFVRYADERRALIWLELVTPGLVRIRYRKAEDQNAVPRPGTALSESSLSARHAASVRVGGRYFALVTLDTLEPDTTYQYTVELGPLPVVGSIPRSEGDYTKAVFPDALPAAVLKVQHTQLADRSFRGDKWMFFRTLRATYEQLRFAHGSCRKWPGDTGPNGKTPGPDMLDYFASEWLAKNKIPDWPRFFLHTGDQIYADDVGVAQGEAMLRQRFAAVIPGPRGGTGVDEGAWAGRFANRYVPIDPKRTAVIAAPTQALREELKRLEADLAKARKAGTVTADIVAKARRSEEVTKALAQEPQSRRSWTFVDPRRPMRFRNRIENGLLWEVPNEPKNMPSVALTGLRARDNARSHYASAGETNAVHAADFAEYAYLYQRAWTTAHARKAMAHVPSFMIFDDHEVTDDWNFNRKWVGIVHEKDDLYRMWPYTMTDALAAYWVYQGWGNLSPEDAKTDPRAQILERCRANGTDALPELRRLILSRSVAPPSATPTSPRLTWYYKLPIASPQVIVMDDRTERDVAGFGTAFRAQMAWLKRELGNAKSTASFIVLSTPFLLPHPVSWAMAHENAARVMKFFDSLKSLKWDWQSIEQFTRSNDLEHAAGNDVWDLVLKMLAEIQDSVTTLKTIGFISGDIHFSCNFGGQLAKGGPPVPPNLVQLVSSGLRQSVGQGSRGTIAWAYKWLPFSTTGKHRNLNVRLADMTSGNDKTPLLYDTSVALVDVDVRKTPDDPRIPGTGLPAVKIRQQHLTWNATGKKLKTYDFRYAFDEAKGARFGA